MQRSVELGAEAASPSLLISFLWRVGRSTPSNYDESAFRLPAPLIIITHSLLPFYRCSARAARAAPRREITHESRHCARADIIHTRVLWSITVLWVMTTELKMLSPLNRSAHDERRNLGLFVILLVFSPEYLILGSKVIKYADLFTVQNET